MPNDPTLLAILDSFEKEVKEKRIKQINEKLSAVEWLIPLGEMKPHTSDMVRKEIAAIRDLLKEL